MLDLLERAVTERGADYVYQPPRSGRCSYVHFVDGKYEPGCGVGLALSYANFSLEEMADWDSNPDDSAINQIESNGLTASAILVLGSFQAEQDQGISWGDALEAAQSVPAGGE